jgi:regulator of protease activity HflC (stomatin/prohibitin superfamily)
MNTGSVLQDIAAVAWLAALGAFAWVGFNLGRNRKPSSGVPTLAGAIVVATLLTTVASGLVFIDPEQRGVVVSAIALGGYRPEALTPGLHWIVPFAERVQIYTIARMTYTMSSTPNQGAVQGDDSVLARTKDGQQVNIDASVIYSINPQKIGQLNISWQDRFENEVVRPLARGIIRDTAGQYNIDEIVTTKRAELVQGITDQVSSRLGANDLVLNDFVLRNIRFSAEYAAAVEQKQIAQQQVEAAALVVEQKQQEAEQARVTAQGQADAAVIGAQGQAQATVLQAQANSQAVDLVGNALKGNRDALTFQSIDKLAPRVRVLYLPSDSAVGGTPLAPSETLSTTVPPLSNATLPAP